MWDCGSPLGSAGRTSHEPKRQNKHGENMHRLLSLTVAWQSKKKHLTSLSTEYRVNNCAEYLAAGQVQGSVPVLIQQCQVSLGPMKKDC